MALTAKKVYAILKRQISDMEAKLNSPVRYRGTVATADLLPLNPDIGDMYNIESKSVYGEAGMNVAWNGVAWDTMGAPIDMSLYFTKEEADTTIQNMVNEYLEKNPIKPGATTEQAQQIEQNKKDVALLKEEAASVEEAVYIAKKSKNLYNSLCDSGEYLIDDDGTIVYPYNNIYSVIIPVEPNKVITIDGKNNGDGFAITTTSKYPTNGTSHTGLVRFSNGEHFTVPSESKYLVIYVNSNGAVDVSGMRVYYGETWNDESKIKADEAIETANLALNNTNSIKPKQTTFFTGYNYGEPSNVSVFEGYVNNNGLVEAYDTSSLIIKNIKPNKDYYIYIPNRNRQNVCISDTGIFEAGKTYTLVDVEQNLIFKDVYVVHIKTNNNAKAIMIYFYNGKYDYENNKDNIIVSEGKWDSNPREHIPIKYMPGEIIRHYGTFSIVGDSYSSFKGYMANPNAATWYPASDYGMNDTNDVENVEQTWWYKFANSYGCRLIENNSWSGSTISYDGYNEGLDDGKDTSFINRIGLLTKPELILVYGGTNDEWCASDTNRTDYLGDYKYSDFQEADFVYFRPSLAYMLSELKKKHVGARIVFMINGFLNGIKESVNTICEHYGIDVCEVSNIDLAHSHPTEKGMASIADQLIYFLNIF